MMKYPINKTTNPISNRGLPELPLDERAKVARIVSDQIMLIGKVNMLENALLGNHPENALKILAELEDWVRAGESLSVGCND